MIVRRGVPLRWRIAILTALAIGVLSILVVVITYAVVRNSLLGDLERGLREDADRIASRYKGESAGGAQPELESLRWAPTGGVVIQLYDNQGGWLASSNTQYNDAILPGETIVKSWEQGTLRNWQGNLLEQDVRAALAPFDRGVVVVFAATGFISTSLRQLAQSLVLTALIIIVSGALLSYFVAATAIRPITQLAAFAAQLDPQNLRPTQYKGPNDEVGQLSHVLNDLVLRLKDALDAQRSFLAETSHELRTPLTSLQGFLDRAARRAHPDVRRDLEDAKRIAHTMSRLVADLLQLSRGELVQELVPHLLDPYTDILEPVAEEFPGVGLAGSPGETLVGDPERLRQLVRNLTANAVRITAAPEKVALSLRSSGNSSGSRVVLEVQDEGPGIPLEQQTQIFDKFYKGAGGGAGLGLAIAKQIADVHGGTLTVKSKPGEGATFSLSLPAMQVEPEEVMA